MASEWYFASGRQKLGPYPLEALKQAARDGRISRSTLIWTEAYGSQWRPADQVEMLKGLLRSSPPPLPDEKPDAVKRGRNQSERQGDSTGPVNPPSTWSYIGAWLVAFLFATLINIANLFLGGMTVAEEFWLGAAMISIGSLFAATAASFVFEALFRQLNMAKVFTAGLWVGAIGIGLTLLNGGFILASGEVLARDMDIFLLLMATPFLFWAVLLANLWRMAKLGRVYPALSCPADRPESKDTPSTKLAWLMVSLAVLAIIYAGLFVAVHG